MGKNSLAQIEMIFDTLMSRLQARESENARLERKIGELTEELKGIKQGRSENNHAIERLKRDRDEIRSRIDKIREHLSTLEKPASEKSVQ